MPARSFSSSPPLAGRGRPCRAGSASGPPAGAAAPGPGPAPSSDFKRRGGTPPLRASGRPLRGGKLPGSAGRVPGRPRRRPGVRHALQHRAHVQGALSLPRRHRDLQRYLVEGVRDGKVPADRRKMVQQLIDEMKSLLAPITFVLGPAQARLTIDGPPGPPRRRWRGPASRRRPRGRGGRRRVRTAAARVHGGGGHTLTLAFRLSPIVRTGKVRVTSSQPGTRSRSTARSAAWPRWPGARRGRAPDRRPRRGLPALPGRADAGRRQERNLDLDLQRPAADERPVYRSGGSGARSAWRWPGNRRRLLAATADRDAAAGTALPRLRQRDQVDADANDDETRAAAAVIGAWWWGCQARRPPRCSSAWPPISTPPCRSSS